MPTPRARTAPWLLALGIATSAPRALCAADFHVDPVLGSDTSGDGSALAPWRTITHAVSALPVSPDCDRILLEPGTYDATSGEQYPIAIPDSVSLIGPASRTATLATGALDGLFHGARGYCGAFENLAFVGTGGRGLYLWSIGALVRNCSFTGYARGIEIHADLFEMAQIPGVSHVIEQDLFVGNGTGVAASSVAQGNIQMQRVDVLLRESLFRDNGVAIEVMSSCFVCLNPGFFTSEVHHVTIDGSIASGIRVTSVAWSGSVHVTDSVVAWSGGFGIEGEAVVERSDFWQNALGDLDQGPLPAGNLALDPLYADRAAGDFHLASGSPCIDRADTVREFDMDLVERPRDGDGDQVYVSDMGCYEAPGPILGFPLYRFDLTSLDPPTPPRATAFPLDASNAGALLVRLDLLPGDLDLPPAGAALSFYSAELPPGSTLRLYHRWGGVFFEY